MESFRYHCMILDDGYLNFDVKQCCCIVMVFESTDICNPRCLETCLTIEIKLCWSQHTKPNHCRIVERKSWKKQSYIQKKSWETATLLEWFFFLFVILESSWKLMELDDELYWEWYSATSFFHAFIRKKIPLHALLAHSQRHHNDPFWWRQILCYSLLNH